MFDEYDAVVYDLDNTLVRLDVDWDEVRSEVAALLRARDLPVEPDSLWAMLEVAERHGCEDQVLAVITDHERAGARTAERLALADSLPGDGPVGVCSLNSQAACRIALERHGLDERVDVVVGRDTVGAYKPDPEPLLAAIDALEVEPTRSLFVGDGDRDAETAERAGVPFRYVHQVA